MTRSNFYLMLYNLLAALCLFPLALALVVAVDSLWGLQEFWSAFWGESKRGTLSLVISDWWLALPWSIGLWLVLRSAKQFAKGSGARFGGVYAALATLTFFCILWAFLMPAIPLLPGAMLLAGLICLLIESLLARCLR